VFRLESSGRFTIVMPTRTSILLALCAAALGAGWGAPLHLSAVGGVVGVFVDRAYKNDQVVYVRSN
jgi:hypothetical protein